MKLPPPALPPCHYNLPSIRTLTNIVQYNVCPLTSPHIGTDTTCVPTHTDPSLPIYPNIAYTACPHFIPPHPPTPFLLYPLTTLPPYHLTPHPLTLTTLTTLTTLPQYPLSPSLPLSSQPWRPSLPHQRVPPPPPQREGGGSGRGGDLPRGPTPTRDRMYGTS